MLLINTIVGSDTKTLTDDEDLRSYFKRQYKEADDEQNEESWDNKYRNIYDSVKHNQAPYRRSNENPRAYTDCAQQLKKKTALYPLLKEVMAYYLLHG